MCSLRLIAFCLVSRYIDSVIDDVIVTEENSEEHKSKRDPNKLKLYSLPTRIL